MHYTVGNRAYGFGIPYVPYNVNKFPPGQGWATELTPVKLPLGWAYAQFYKAYPAFVPPPRLPRPKDLAGMSPADCKLWAARRSYWGVNNMGPVC